MQAIEGFFIKLLCLTNIGFQLGIIYEKEYCFAAIDDHPSSKLC
jgi:hypothetical protein